MTTQTDKLRSLLLVALMVFSVFAGTMALSGNAVADRDQAGNIGSLPDTVFMGEEDLTFEDFGSSDTLTFDGDAGEADGTFISDENGDVDITSTNGFATGSYIVDNGDGENLQLSVRESNIDDVTLESSEGADITGGTIEQGEDIHLTADYNFDRADTLDLTLEDEDDFDVTNSLSTDASGTSGIDLGSGEVVLDTSELDEGTYNLTVEGSDLSADHTVQFTLGDTDTAISLNNESVIKGEKVTATVTGEAGATQFVQIASSDLDDDVSVEPGTAEEVFDNTGDVDDRSAGDDYVWAEVSLGDDGQAEVRFDTAYLDADNTATIEVANGGGAEAEDDVDLAVEEPNIEIDEAPSTVAIGEDFEINGTAPEIDSVVTYVKVDNTWHLVSANSDGDNPVDVDDDGSFTVGAHADNELGLPGSYRIGVVDANSPMVTDGEGGVMTQIDNDYWGDEASPTDSTSIRSIEGDLGAELSRTSIAANVGDEVDLTGGAVGQSEVGYYVVDPRGNVEAVDDIDVEDNEFSETVDAHNNFQTRGTYEIIVAGTARDGGYVGGNTPESIGNDNAWSQEQAIEVILERHDGTGTQDDISRLNLTANSPSISIDSVDEVLQEETEFTGESNRQPGTVMFVEVTNDNGDVVASGQTEVSDGGTWNHSLDLSEVETGSYTLTIDGDQTSASTQIEVVDELSEEPATEDPSTEEPSTDEPATEDPSTEEPSTDEPTEEPATDTPSDGEGPGFTIVAALGALIAAALLAVRRNN